MPAATKTRPPSPVPAPDWRERWSRLAVWGLPLATGLVLAAPHLSHALWHDELYTLLFFSQSPSQAVFDYHAPNNHILFSLFLSLWRMTLGAGRADIADNLLGLRLLPLAGWIAALVLMPLAVSRLSGRPAGALAGLCLATSHAALNVATELRGYSWSAGFAAAALYALARDRETPGPRWAGVYALAGAAAVATVPTNLAAFATLAALFVLLSWERDGIRLGVFREQRSWWFFLSPLAGLAIYLPVAGQVRGSLAQGSSSPFAALAREWPEASLLDYVWLTPFLVIGLWLAARKKASWVGLAALAAAILVPLAVTLPLPRKPIAYNFAPILPIVYASLGLALAPAVEWLGRRPRARAAILALTAAGLIGLGYWREATGAGYWTRAREGAHLHNLYDQWFQVDYRVVEAVTRVRELLRQPNTAAVVGNCDPLSFFQYSQLLFPAETRANPTIWVGNAEAKPDLWQSYVRRNPHFYLVADSEADARNTVRRLRLEDRGVPVKIDDLGFYKIYELRRDAPRPAP